MPRKKKGSENWEYFENEDLMRNRASGIFYALKSFRGLPQLSRSTGETDKRKAKAKLPQYIREHLEEHQDGRVRASSSPSVGEVIEEMLAGQGERKPLRRKTVRSTPAGRGSRSGSARA